jgi:hypothetical protein
VTFRDRLCDGHYTEYLSGKIADVDAATRLELKPWSSMIFVKRCQVF